MAILEGGHIVPPHTQATSRSPAPLGLMDLNSHGFTDFENMCLYGLYADRIRILWPMLGGPVIS